MICAAEYEPENGTDGARRASNEDERWGYGPRHVFVQLSAPSVDDATTLVLPPEQWREGTARGPLIDNFGADCYAEAHRVASFAGKGRTCYEFTSFQSGFDQPEQTYSDEIDWDGQTAIIGAGMYRRDLPGSCDPSEVSTATLGADGTDERLAEFVQWAAMEVQENGCFATPVPASDPRRRNDSIAVFLANPMPGAVMVVPLGDELTGSGINILSGGRNMTGVGSACGESNTHYHLPNPTKGVPGREVGFATRVLVDGMPMLVVSGYFPTAPLGLN